MTNAQIKAKIRTGIGSAKVDQLRQDGQLPAVLYGHRVASRNIVIPHNDFIKVYRQAGASTLVDIVIDGGAAVPALIQEVQVDPVSQAVIHVDFHQVNLRERITARINLHFVGVSPAVKEAGGVLMTNLTDLEVSSLPQDLVHEITVDISKLKTFSDYIHVSDLKLPNGIQPTAKTTTVVAHVIPPRSEEELAALQQQPAATAAAADVPVAGKEEKEHAEGTGATAEGATPPAPGKKTE
ncbi:MAG: 50S ribosomal protein L25 [Patescibacteria group bacterium]|nr:50S ribosomal protein L25 [Patescibacteria group bacterium]